MNSKDWAAVFAGGLSGWLDSQSGDRGSVNDPTYNTQGGRAGESQVTSLDQVLRSPVVIGIAVVVVVGLVLIAAKK